MLWAALAANDGGSMLPEKKQILVVDDEPNLRRVLSALLIRDDYDVATAEDGAQALEILGEHHIDMVITDLRMPRIDGIVAPHTRRGSGDAGGHHHSARDGR
jgi:CheY-like chemotaxis protein